MTRRRLPLLVIIATAGAAAALLARNGFPLTRATVAGPSMEPAFRDGDRIVALRRAWTRAAPRAGDALLLADPLDGRLIIKRAAFDASRAGPVFLLGDNPPHSRDSRHFGEVPATAIIGRVVFRY